jgi:type 1 glutamine amidotransferase
MKVSSFLILCIALVLFSCGQGRNDSAILATINVNSGEFERFDTPLSFSIDAITQLDQNNLRLYEIRGNQREPVTAQFSGGEKKVMHWIMAGHTQPHQSRVFELRKGNPPGKELNVRLEKKEDSYVFYSIGKPVMQYNHAVVPAPEGKDPAFERSGFIHPLYAPNNAVLTAIHTESHTHHFGVWNPWTKTTFRGEEVDFWNLGKKEGTVRFGEMLSMEEGPVFGSLKVLHEHIAWPASTKETLAMKEQQEMKVYYRSNHAFLVEINSHLTPVEELILEEYRYGGFVLRATDQWTNKTTKFFTSEGLERDEADGERALWCVVNGETPEGKAGILMMGHPANYNHPEPVRVWPSDAFRGRGDMFINFSPTRNTEWALQPGQTYSLKYRMLVFEGEMDKESAARTWNDLTNPPLITLQRPMVAQKDVGKHDNRIGNVKGSNVLVYTRNGEGFVHKSIPASVEAFKKLSAESGFKMDVSDDPSVFNDENLKKYHALVFLNTNNDVFDTDEQRLALKRYVQAGGGFVGVHIAIGTERKWTWYKQMIGGTFDRHPPYQDFRVRVLDKSHPSAKHLPDTWEIKDEPYYIKEFNPEVRVLLAHDLTSIEDKREKPTEFGDDYPAVWCNTFDGGRQWYTSFGHDDHIFENPLFMQHILGGIEWVIADGLPDYSKSYSTMLVR